jgi:hypothetical protein
VRSCLAWDSTYDLKYGCVISAYIKSLCVWVGVYVGFPCLVLMWVYVGLRVCDVLFSCSVFPVVCFCVRSVTSARMALSD